MPYVPVPYVCENKVGCSKKDSGNIIRTYGMISTYLCAYLTEDVQEAQQDYSYRKYVRMVITQN